MDAGRTLSDPPYTLAYPYTEKGRTTLWRVSHKGGEPEIVWQSPIVILGAMLFPDGKRSIRDVHWWREEHGDGEPQGGAGADPNLLLRSD